MKARFQPKVIVAAAVAATIVGMATGMPAMAQMDNGPKTEKTYGIGLPRDHARTLFADEDFPVFALKPGQEAYKDIDGYRAKKDVVALAKIALDYRDKVNKQWWGRFPGTEADKAGVRHMTAFSWAVSSFKVK